MPGPDLVYGFRVRIGTEGRPGGGPGGHSEPGSAPRFAVRGTHVPVHDGTAYPLWSGTAVTLGRPPVLVADGQVRLLLAGELYNRAELTGALGGSSAALGDAELLLAAWRRWGPGAFRLLNGRFAALLTDASTGATVAATDHAGSVPLWLRADVTGLSAATEAKTLAHEPGRPLGLSGTHTAPGAAGVCRVPAGTALLLHGVGGSDITARAVRTWTPPLSRALPGEREAVDLVGERLATAVRTRLRGGEAAPTVVLSGGIDSGGVAAHTAALAPGTRSVSMGTEVSDEFDAARSVAVHLGTAHSEIRLHSAELVRELPWAVAAAEITDPTVLEYLLPLVALYRRLDTGPLRILTGYGADIPLGGMHRRTASLWSLDDEIAGDMAGFDGLNEMSPVLAGIAGKWTTHPYWDRAVLDALVSLEPGLKRRRGTDKWVLRQALSGLLPAETVARPKLGIHEGSGTTSAWTGLLLAEGIRRDEVTAVKGAMARRLYDAVVIDTVPPEDVDFGETVRRSVDAVRRLRLQGRVVV
ncbi:asparagine synthase-related protein [Streptomyces clavuligerus]|uniref:asparagine synthase (glutamine-hydrolyzing) n=1 Tax=Streptomyces clavuligerus TaxID=1901 RepID=Q6TA06_STRCL|nr:beta-lactam synthetase isoenzyme 1 [Streptomyces clavuligerus]EFG04561.1 Beta-lactam synthetase isoenzyme 1 [Streptomyces clavuligerus]